MYLPAWVICSLRDLQTLKKLPGKFAKKSCSVKFRKIYKKHAIKLFFNNAQSKAYNFAKIRPNHTSFHVNARKFSKSSSPVEQI